MAFREGSETGKSPREGERREKDSVDGKEERERRSQKVLGEGNEMGKEKNSER